MSLLRRLLEGLREASVTGRHMGRHGGPFDGFHEFDIAPLAGFGEGPCCAVYVAPASKPFEVWLLREGGNWDEAETLTLDNSVKTEEIIKAAQARADWQRVPHHNGYIGEVTP